MSTSPIERVPEWTLQDRLRKARLETGMNTRQFAESIGVTQTTVSGAETGRHKPRRLLLNAWSLATGVPRQWLETGIAPRPKPEGDEVRHQGLEPRTRCYGAQTGKTTPQNVLFMPKSAPRTASHRLDTARDCAAPVRSFATSVQQRAS